MNGSNDPDMGSWSAAYDLDNRVISRTDALLQTTAFTYDALSRLTSKTARSGTASAEITTNSYDQAASGFYNVGQLTTSTRSAPGQNPVTQTYNFDIGSRLVQQQWTVDGATQTMTAAYDAGSRLLYKTFPDGDSLGSAAAPLTYDTAGFPVVVPGLVNAQTYNPRGEPLAVSYANGVTSTLAYNDARDWLNTVVHANGAGTLESLTYTRGITGRINSVASDTSAESWSYGYDDLDRLTSATNAGNSALNQSWQYDTSGNITYNVSVMAAPPRLSLRVAAE